MTTNCAINTMQYKKSFMRSHLVFFLVPNKRDIDIIATRDNNKQTDTIETNQELRKSFSIFKENKFDLKNIKLFKTNMRKGI